MFGRGDLTDGVTPGEFSGTHATFSSPWDGRQISRALPLSGDASVSVWTIAGIREGGSVCLSDRDKVELDSARVTRWPSAPRIRHCAVRKTRPGSTKVEPMGG